MQTLICISEADGEPVEISTDRKKLKVAPANRFIWNSGIPIFWNLSSKESDPIKGISKL